MIIDHIHYYVLYTGAIINILNQLQLVNEKNHFTI